METNSNSEDGYDTNPMASMGFGTFGAQGHRKNKKRRMNPEETSISDSARGSNAMPLRKPRRPEGQARVGSGQDERLLISTPDDNKEPQEQQQALPPSEHINETSSLASVPSFPTLVKHDRHGMDQTQNSTPNHDGGQPTNAYYSPRFVENPWQELEGVLKERDRIMTA